MKRIVFVIIALLTAGSAYAEDEKIDPETYICAELIAANVDGQPPIFQGLQLDGYDAGRHERPVADADTLAIMLVEVSNSCAAKPAEKVMGHWQKIRRTYPAPDDSPWRADKTTCGDYQANPDDGSGFVIWLDGYHRGKSGKKTSVLTDQATLDHFLKVCAANPKRLMLDVLAENAK